MYEDYTVITEYFGEDFRVNIPSRLGGKSVKGIGDNAIGKSVLAIEIVDTWLGTEYSNMEKHTRRINKISAYESEAK